MKIYEVVGELLKGYEREYAENIKLAEEAWNVYRVTDKFEDKLHYNHMFMDMLTAHGKIKAAREILTALTEESNENSQGRQADS